MLRSYFKMAWRNLVKHKMCSFINIAKGSRTESMTDGCDKRLLILTLAVISSIPGLLGQDRTKELDKFFSALVETQQFSGNVLVAEHGRVIYERSFGYADYVARVKNTPGISFPIASISKTLVATAILQLQEKGKLQISDPVVKYLPEFPYPDVLIKHLLSHTSGLPPYNAFFDSVKNANPQKVFTNADFLPGLAHNIKPKVYVAGAKGNYDNINYLVLAVLIQKITGAPYEQYVQVNILRPAGMKDTRFFLLPDQFNTDNIANFSFPHLYPHLYDSVPIRSNSVPYIRSYWHAYAFTGFSDYVSTTLDLLKYDQALRSGKLLKTETLREVYTPVRQNDGSINREYFGLGWEVEKDTSLGLTVYHSGVATGLSSVLLRNITRDQTVILFDNVHYNAHENGTRVLKILNDQPIVWPKKGITFDYANVLLKQGAVAAKAELLRLRQDTTHYYLSEGDLNLLGYDFLGTMNTYRLPEAVKLPEALATFKLIMELFPDSWNAYDSYGEALLKNGETVEAIRMYEKSVELNPKNEGGKKVLVELKKK